MDAPETSHTVHWAFDDSLHGAIAKNSGNVSMVNTIATLRRTTRLFEQMEVPQPKQSPGTEEHLRIIEEMQGGGP